ncbi:NAD(P)-dependent oxidoreductase, partial [Burkholderia sola]|uniref:NAD(P)-dependent oxidoreductase n=1 Tax=Burkholderia sola TaxID=2843302 RepID=UPI00338F22CE
VVARLCREPGGLLESARAGQTLVDLSTSPVDTTRALAAEFQARGVRFADAPVARTRAAAEAGTLAVMVGAEPTLFEALRPLIATFASDIALCGPVGCGQVLKILNNMVLFETVVAFSEAKAIAEKAGVDPAVLFDTLSKGSADSFALRNHGMKAVLPGEFPERAFSVRYARKDLTYALQLAREAGVDARG